MTASFIYVTAATADEARRIARTLIEERLAACANILPPHRAIYRWEGAVQEADEVAMILKTRVEAVDRLTARIRALHSYDCPCIVALPITAGDAAFLAWIGTETA